MDHLLDLLALVSIGTGLWYLGSAADLTFAARWWIAAYAPPIHRLLICPACSGTWFGFGLAAVAEALDRPVLGLDLPVAIPVTGLVFMVWVPVLAAQLLKNLSAVSEYLDPAAPSTVGEPTEDDCEQDQAG